MLQDWGNKKPVTNTNLSYQNKAILKPIRIKISNLTTTIISLANRIILKIVIIVLITQMEISILVLIIAIIALN